MMYFIHRQVECRLSIGSKGLTNTKVNFQYFSVGDATKTVAFGPGLLHGTAPAVPVVFMIQARDKVIHLRGTRRIAHGDNECWRCQVGTTYQVHHTLFSTR